MVVDKSVTVYNREKAEWKKYDIDAFRVETMSEAINLLADKVEFFFIAINEDTILDFMLKLPIMRGVTSLPIFVITSSHTIEKKVKAIDQGADVYDPFNTNARENVINAMALLKVQSRWAKRPQKTPQILIEGGIILSPLRRTVFMNDTKVLLTKKEFDILHCLMANNGHVVTHTYLMQKFWSKKHGWKKTEVIWRTVDRIRRKLSQISPNNEYISVERGVGYRFSTAV